MCAQEADLKLLQTVCQLLQNTICTPAVGGSYGVGISLKQHLIDIERNLIEQALSRTQGNVSQTAKLLQLQRTTLIEKINKYELRGAA